ncbi:aldehyde dehydrogenase [Aliidongia dinghuensis]|uniref:Aldehyde dehydrogenase n=1 Tax=Aliidongia dinghuensis TaxID=1867774 RepID=A0A8J2Z110_9PROT|nr:molybdopterin cofactor-binding domain-containing protein [Aliidongia dinghuensis]GGF49794.1 aldehyde dehydrogenase [Aliidongia dinghuensis]
MTRPSRRAFISGGALVVAFSLAPRAFAQMAGELAGGGEGSAGPKVIAPNLPGSLRSHPWLDAWIRIDAQGHATVYTGKAELGQGIKTALLQVAAEELDLPPASVELITVDTRRTPDEGLTAGSHSMQDSGTAIHNAAANVRLLLTQAAARQWSLAPESLTTTGDGHVRAPDGRLAPYGALASALSLHVEAIPNAPHRAPATFRTMGKDLPRVDIPAKVTGGAAYVQDMRLPGMLHARVLRGPSFGTRLKAIDAAAVEALPGVVKLVLQGGFAAVVAETEWHAIQALRFVQQGAFERTAPRLPAGDAATILKALSPEEITVLDTHDVTAAAVRTLKAKYSRPWINHGSIGPSCAVALFKDGELTLWTHSQGTYDAQRVAAELLSLPADKVHAIHTEGSGCYGQNGADDVAADAAFIAHALPGRPIRLQWMREQEFGWEPLGCAMATELEASLDADNKIVEWRHQVWSNPHNNRPVGAGGVLVGTEIVPSFTPPPVKPIPMPEGDGDRNSNPLYALPNMHVLYHFLKDMPLRVSALRSLGAHLNVFSIECMLDELAKAGGIDPLAFRLAHMADERARTVIETATGKFGWAERPKGNGRVGCGMGFARYKNIGAYCAVAMEIELDRETGEIAVRRAVAAVDAGQPVNPDGIRNQIEGGIIQSISWTSREAVTYDAQRRTSFDWSAYPILRFLDIPDAVEVHVVDRPGLPFLGTAEAAQGPTAAAFANALADAAGIRLRDMPLSPDKVKAAIGAI